MLDGKWPGIPPGAWPRLNELLDLVRSGMNWRSDGTVQFQRIGGTMTMGVSTLPDNVLPAYQAVILGGGQPYSWAKLRVDPNTFGVYYTDWETFEAGWCAGQQVVQVTRTSWSGGVIQFTLQADIGLTPGQLVQVQGVNPPTFNGLYTVTLAVSLTFTAVLLTDPTNGGLTPYVTGGAACAYGAGTNAFRPAYEENNSTFVPVGSVVRMMPRVLDSDVHGTDEEQRFQIPYASAEFWAVILGGNNPYSWAEAVAFTGGVWYTGVQVGYTITWPATLLTNATWASTSGGQATFTTLVDLGLSAGNIVRVQGTDPSGYDGLYTVVSATTGQFVVAQTVNPGIYVANGAMAVGVTGTASVNQAYEEEGDPNVPAGSVVRMRVRFVETTGLLEYSFGLPDVVQPIRYTNPGVLNANGYYDAFVQVWNEATGSFSDGAAIQVVPN